jgi:hypothetical protein
MEGSFSSDGWTEAKPETNCKRAKYKLNPIYTTKQDYRLQKTCRHGGGGAYLQASTPMS